MTRCNREPCPGELDATGKCWVCLMPPLTEEELERAQAARAPEQPVVHLSEFVSRPSLRGRTQRSETVTTPPHPPTPRAPAAPPSPMPAAPSNDDSWWALSLITPAPIPAREPEAAVLADTTLPDDRRKCPTCRRPVGFGHDGQPPRDEGKCPYDGTRYSFVPRLHRGDVVDGRYEVAGCIGFGGLGWVYLGYDRRLNNRSVALKGLIDADSPRAVEDAEEEKRHLIRFNHEDIVTIWDFVTHVRPDERQRGYHVYIVMEYVPGYALTDDRAPALEVEQVVWYVLRTLRVFHYLHENGYLFCDLKPSNLMVHGSAVKIIDLGAVRELGAAGTGTYTDDYAAPELHQTGATVATDLFTVGKTLGELFDLHADRPDRPEYASLRAVIDRATAPVDLRFPTASDMACQLSGVLRDLVAWRDGRAVPAPSLRFARTTALIDNGLGSVPELDRWLTTGARRAASSGVGRALDTRPPSPAVAMVALPAPLPDARDGAAGFLTDNVSADPVEAARQLQGYQARTAGVEFHLCRVLLRLGDADGAAAALGRGAAMAQRGDWRIDWHQGLLALSRGRAADARAAFEACAAALPGEVAPRLALAVCAEYLAAGDPELADAAAAYLSVWRTDPWYESAALGCARVRARLGDRSGAVAVLGDVPDTSPHYRSLRVAAFRIRTGRLGAPGNETLPDVGDLTAAEHEVAAVAARESDTARLEAVIVEAALDRMCSAGPDAGRPPDTALFANAQTEDGLRLELSEKYRALARQAREQDRQTILVDLANAVRPMTLT